jgi:hypothetical protein
MTYCRKMRVFSMPIDRKQLTAGLERIPRGTKTADFPVGTALFGRCLDLARPGI